MRINDLLAAFLDFSFPFPIPGVWIGMTGLHARHTKPGLSIRLKCLAFFFHGFLGVYEMYDRNTRVGIEIIQGVVRFSYMLISMLVDI